MLELRGSVSWRTFLGFLSVGDIFISVGDSDWTVDLVIRCPRLPARHPRTTLRTAHDLQLQAKGVVAPRSSLALDLIHKINTGGDSLHGRGHPGSNSRHRPLKRKHIRPGAGAGAGASASAALLPALLNSPSVFATPLRSSTGVTSDGAQTEISNRPTQRQQGKTSRTAQDMATTADAGC
jgi:hypothetical protein